MAKGKSGETITVTQYRSAAGYDKTTKSVLQALGLGRIGKKKSYQANPALLGQVARIAHLVKVSKA